jgi:hypothetical protein
LRLIKIGRMNVLIFKTNIRFKKDLEKIGAFLGGIEPALRWNVDRQDTDKVLRVVSSSADPLKIVSMIRQAGYHCEELPD